MERALYWVSVGLSITTAAFLFEIVCINFVLPGTILANALITIIIIIIGVRGIDVHFTKGADSCVSSINAGHQLQQRLGLLKFFWNKYSIHSWKDFLVVLLFLLSSWSFDMIIFNFFLHLLLSSLYRTYSLSIFIFFPLVNSILNF